MFFTLDAIQSQSQRYGGVTLIYVNLQEFKHICEQYFICEYESDLPSYEHYLISSERKA